MLLEATSLMARLEIARQMRGISRNELSEEMGYHRHTLARMVKSPATAKLSQMIDMAKALGVTLSLDVVID
ncbi:MAG: hypothetical protein COB37_10390 [Kordiimonadales bacterium]|nr:MAG: hypothetical protein COB37_10390 [Kordiimonadales bacterium]